MGRGPRPHQSRLLHPHFGGLAIQKIDHKAIDFAQPGLGTIELQNDFAPEDITAKAQPLAAAAKRETK